MTTDLTGRRGVRIDVRGVGQRVRGGRRTLRDVSLTIRPGELVAVTDPSQATLALPMLCFPQVLFVGAILPVPIMAAVGRWLSYGMSNRWPFEALGHTLGHERLWAHGGSPLGPPLLASYGDTFGRPVLLDWAVLGGFSALSSRPRAWSSPAGPDPRRGSALVLTLTRRRLPPPGERVRGG